MTWKSLLPKEMAVGEEMVAEGIVPSSIFFSRDLRDPGHMWNVRLEGTLTACSRCSKLPDSASILTS